MTTILYLPVTTLTPNPYQPPTRNYGDIPSLAANITAQYAQRPETFGLIQPVQIRLLRTSPKQPDDDDELDIFAALGHDLYGGTSFYENTPEEAAQLLAQAGLTPQIASGHRRHAAFTHLAQTDHRYHHGRVPVQIITLTDEDMLREVFIENDNRPDITALDHCHYLTAALDQLRTKSNPNPTLKQAAELIHMDYGQARDAWQLRDLATTAPALAQLLREGRIGQTILNEMLPLIRIAPWCQITRAVGTGNNQHLTPAQFIQKAAEEPPSRANVRAYIAALVKQGYSESDSLAPLDEKMMDFECIAEGTVSPTCKQCPAKLTSGGAHHCTAAECWQIRQRTAAFNAYDGDEEIRRQHEWVDDLDEKHTSGQQYSKELEIFADYIRQCHDLRRHDKDIIVGYSNRDRVRPFQANIGRPRQNKVAKYWVAYAYRGDWKQMLRLAQKEKEREITTAATQPSPDDMSASGQAGKKKMAAWRDAKLDFYRERAIQLRKFTSDHMAHLHADHVIALAPALADLNTLRLLSSDFDNYIRALPGKPAREIIAHQWYQDRVRSQSLITNHTICIERGWDLFTNIDPQMLAIGLIYNYYANCHDTDMTYYPSVMRRDYSFYCLARTIPAHTLPSPLDTDLAAVQEAVNHHEMKQEKQQ